jgi:quinol monooxygenase YgiN
VCKTFAHGQARAMPLTWQFAENKFAVHEIWHSNEDIDAHFEEAYFKEFAAELQQHLAGPNALTIAKYRSVSFILRVLGRRRGGMMRFQKVTDWEC